MCWPRVTCVQMTKSQREWLGWLQYSPRRTLRTFVCNKTRQVYSLICAATYCRDFCVLCVPAQAQTGRERHSRRSRVCGAHLAREVPGQHEGGGQGRQHRPVVCMPQQPTPHRIVSPVVGKRSCRNTCVDVSFSRSRCNNVYALLLQGGWTPKEEKAALQEAQRNKNAYIIGAFVPFADGVDRASAYHTTATRLVRPQLISKVFEIYPL